MAEIPVRLATEVAKQDYTKVDVREVAVQVFDSEDPNLGKIQGSKYETPNKSHRDLGLLTVAQEDTNNPGTFVDIDPAQEGTAFINKIKLIGTAEGIKVALQTRADAEAALNEVVKARGDDPEKFRTF